MTELYEGGPLTVSQEARPCELHRYHSPITRVNELHHVYPVYLQKRLFGRADDQTLISICGTGHTSVHTAISYWLRWADWPDWCVGQTRALAKTATDWYMDSL